MSLEQRIGGNPLSAYGYGKENSAAEGRVMGLIGKGRIPLTRDFVSRYGDRITAYVLGYDSTVRVRQLLETQDENSLDEMSAVRLAIGVDFSNQVRDILGSAGNGNPQEADRVSQALSQGQGLIGVALMRMLKDSRGSVLASVHYEAEKLALSEAIF